MKRELIYRTAAMAAVGNLKGLSDTDKSKAMQAVLGVPAVQTCEDAVSRQAVLQMLTDIAYNYCKTEGQAQVIDWIKTLVCVMPSAPPERRGWVHIDDIYRLIAGHSDYHGDNILSALTCLAEGKKVSKPITILDTERTGELPAVQPQPEEDCDTCKHGYFGDRQCDNCRVRYPSHYERDEEQHGSD